VFSKRVTVEYKARGVYHAGRCMVGGGHPWQGQALWNAGRRARRPGRVRYMAPALPPVTIEVFRCPQNLIDPPRLDRTRNVQSIAYACASGQREIPALAVAPFGNASAGLNLQPFEFPVEHKVDHAAQ